MGHVNLHYRPNRGWFYYHQRSSFLAERANNPALPDDWDDDSDTTSDHRPTERMALRRMEQQLLS